MEHSPAALKLVGGDCRQREKIETMVFVKCNGLKEVILPQYIKEIGDELFLQCTQLEKITLPPSVETIGKDAFTNCFKLKKILPDALRHIKKYVFLSSGLVEINIPPGVIGIELGAFQG
jgi:hypothetical protein